MAPGISDLSDTCKPKFRRDFARSRAPVSEKKSGSRPMTLANRIKDLRQKAGKSARQLSIAAGLSPGTVQAIETDPKKSPQLSSVQRIAEELGVSLAYLVEGDTPNARADGLEENDAVPYMLAAPAGQRPDLVEPQRLLPQILAPLGRQLTTYRLRAAMPGFALLPGDVLVVDLKTPPSAGDLVLANVADLAVGSASTVLRRYLPPYLVANDAGADAAPLVVDNHRTSLLGRVAASFRAPQLGSV